MVTKVTDIGHDNSDPNTDDNNAINVVVEMATNDDVLDLTDFDAADTHAHVTTIATTIDIPTVRFLT